MDDVVVNQLFPSAYLQIERPRDQHIYHALYSNQLHFHHNSLSSSSATATLPENLFFQSISNSTHPDNNDRQDLNSPIDHIPDDSPVDEEPLYVNAKQYFRILKRRVARARLEEVHRLSRQRKVLRTLPLLSFFLFILSSSPISMNLVISMLCAVRAVLAVAS